MLKIKKEYAKYAYWVLFFAIILLKYAYYEYKYYPVMDDWIQYGTYSLSEHPFEEILSKTKAYTVRPLATLSDVYLITKFWNHMGLLFFLLTVLHAISAYLFSRVFKFLKIKTGYIFLIFYALIPFASEATYWISASSRLVLGTFFTALSLFFLCRYLFADGKRRDIVYFSIIQLMSLCYYEPVFMLGLVLTVFIVVPNLKKLRAKETGLISIINYCIIVLYYSYFSNKGETNLRGIAVGENETADYQKTLDNIIEMLHNSDTFFYLRGFRRGLEVIIHDKAYIFLIIVSIFAILGYFISRIFGRERNIYVNLKKIVIGMVLFAAPFSVFFLIKFNWISFRNAFTSLVGFALILEALVDISFKNWILSRIKASIVALLIFAFLIINVSELTDYRDISLVDKKICTNIIATSEGTGLLQGKNIGLLINVSSSYCELNKYFHEHINNVTSSAWLLTGATRGIYGKTTIKTITPVTPITGIMMMPSDINKYVILGMEDDLKISLLTYERMNNVAYKLFRTDGTEYGHIRYRYGLAFFEKK